MSVCSLYRITLPDGRAYIGAAKKPNVRFVEHCRGKYLIGESIRVAGKENVSFQVLASGEQDYIFDLEGRAVEAFGTRWPQGLNVASGGYGGRDHLPHIRERISERCRGPKSDEARANIAKGRRGIRLSAETRTKIALANIGKKKSLETRAKISAAMIGHVKSSEAIANMSAAHVGIKHSEESRRKMSASKSGRPWSAARRATFERASAQ